MMNKKNVYKLFLFLFMLLAFFISVYPLLWVVIQSLKTETQSLRVSGPCRPGSISKTMPRPGTMPVCPGIS